MKKKIPITIAGLALAGALVSLSSHGEEYPRPPSLPSFFDKFHCDQVINKRYFKICYDYGYKGARFVAYTLVGALVNKRNIKERPRFYPERAVPSKYRAYPSDYTRNPYHMDRGHLAPDADFDWSMRPLKATYSMANIVPQYYLLNRKMWSKAERYERYIATKLGRVYVLNIVAYPQSRKTARRVGGKGTAIPVAFAKVIWNPKKDFMACFIYTNRAVSKAEAEADRLKDHVVPCRDILGAQIRDFR